MLRLLYMEQDNSSRRLKSSQIGARCPPAYECSKGALIVAMAKPIQTASGIQWNLS